jgi:hypothetical protein
MGWQLSVVIQQANQVNSQTAANNFGSLLEN